MIKIKRYGNIYEKIYDYENLKQAHYQARKGKTHYDEVKKVDDNLDEHLIQLQNMLIWKTYKTSEYDIFIKNDSGKEREIYKLPYFPDRICQWAIMLQIEKYITKPFVNFSCASIKNKGIHYALKLLNKYMKDEENTKYCLKLDIKKFFPNVNHQILKNMLRKKLKDNNLLWLLDEIIDSIEGYDGVPIGNYTSQYFANFYLTYLDHWLKEEKRLKYVIRYMDDIIILHSDKAFLHNLRIEIENYLKDNLNLKLKGNYQVFPSRIRGIDFVGYRHFGKYILLRKSTYKKLRSKSNKIYYSVKKLNKFSYSDYCCVNSYNGWLDWCNSYNLKKSYINNIYPYCIKYHKEVIIGDN